MTHRCSVTIGRRGAAYGGLQLAAAYHPRPGGDGGHGAVNGGVWGEGHVRRHWPASVLASRWPAPTPSPGLDLSMQMSALATSCRHLHRPRPLHPLTAPAIASLSIAAQHLSRISTVVAAARARRRRASSCDPPRRPLVSKRTTTPCPPSTMLALLDPHA
ncbi:hypothetical protein ACJQWK_11388 [Exserohilum turcicum]